MKRVLVVAPHPDDETLGCGGTLLKHVAQGDEVHWLIVSAMTAEVGFSPEAIERRRGELRTVAGLYGFAAVHEAGVPTTRVDGLPTAELIARLSRTFAAVEPEVVYLPHPGDVHTDHRAVFEAAAACTKWFRCRSVRRILAYETLSETDASIRPETAAFRPNVFVDITSWLDRKVQILGVYSSELGPFPFPRSVEAVRALAAVRGASAGCNAAEAFTLLKELA